MAKRQESEWVSGRADEVPKARNVGAIGTNAAGIDGQAEALGEI